MKVILDLRLEFDYILCSVISKAKRTISVKCANVSCEGVWVRIRIECG